MNKLLLACVLLLPFLGAGAYIVLKSMFPGHDWALFGAFTLFTIVECTMLAALAFSILKRGAPPR